MSRLGFITAVAKQGVSSKEMRSKISKSNLFFRDHIKYNTFDKRDTEWIEWDKILRKQKEMKDEISFNQVDIMNGQ